MSPIFRKTPNLTSKYRMLFSLALHVRFGVFLKFGDRIYFITAHKSIFSLSTRPLRNDSSYWYSKWPEKDPTCDVILFEFSTIFEY